MNTPFSDLNIAPGVGADIMRILGVSATDLNFPKKLQQVQDITDYFKNTKNYREKILKITSGKSGDDKIDMAWSYVQLQRERENKISKLDPQDFEPDVVEQIKNKYLTKDKISLLKKDIINKVKQEQVKLQELQVKKAKNQFEESYIQQVMGSLKKFETITLTLEEVEKINQRLNYE